MDQGSGGYAFIPSADGVRLCVRSSGTGRPVVFVHGFSQSHLAWARQFAGPLASTFRLCALDLRGHGWSDRPLAREAYKESQRWADDVAAVLATLEEPAVVVAWSYGGRVACDYLAVHGTRGIAGINFVGAMLSSENDLLGSDVGLVGATCAEDPAASIEAARAFVRGCFASEPPREHFETVLAYTAMVPPQIRRMALARPLEARELLRALDVPVLFTHGTLDRIIAPAMSAFGAGLVANSRTSLYEGVGHSPFYEAAERFDRELAEFIEELA